MQMETGKIDPADSPSEANPAVRALAHELMRLRLERGLSLRKLARLVGMTAHSGLVDYERGSRIPPGDLMSGLVGVLKPSDDRLTHLYRAAVAERVRRRMAGAIQHRTDVAVAALDVGAGTDRLVTADADAPAAKAANGAPLSGRQRSERAYRLAEQAGEPVGMGVAALGLNGFWVHECRTAVGSALLQARLEHALSLVEPQSSLALRLRIRLAGETDYRTGEHDAILASLDEARSLPDPVARMEALNLAHQCLLGPDHGTLRRSLALEMVNESLRTGNRGDLLSGLLWQTVDALIEADPHARRLLTELRHLLEPGSHRAVESVAGAIEVMLTIRSGRFDEAEALARVCAERGRAAGDINAAGWHGTHLVAIRWFQGRLPQLLPTLRAMVHSPKLSAVDNSCLAALAVAAALAGSRREAAGALATLCGSGLAQLPRSSTWLATMGGIAEAAALLDDVDTCARAYELLQPFAHLPMMPGPGVACFGSVHHSLGVAALTMGQADRSAAHLRAAVNGNLAIAHWPAAMISRVRCAEALSRRARPGDETAAERELATAAEEAAAIGVALP